MNQHPSAYLIKRKQFESRLIKIMIGLLFAFAAFIAGFFARGDLAFLTYLGFETGVQSTEQNPGMTVSGSTFNSVSARVAEAQGVLDSQSMDSYDLESTTADMLNALAENTNDPFVAYLTDEQYDAYLSASTDSYKGIGVLFGENRGEAYVVDVFSGSQAEAEGVQPGDYVVAISGDKGSGRTWTQTEVVKAIENAQDGSLYITWRRPATLSAKGGEEYSTHLRVSTFQEPNVVAELSDDGVAYIRLGQFTSNSADLVAQAIAEMEEGGASAYVLDIRDNPGGYLTQAIDVGSLFLDNGSFVQITTRASTTTREVGGKTATLDPLVVITNGKTCAAAEVLAGGLRDNERCTLIGETTQGKGSVQSVTGLSFGGGIRYTSAYYKTPKGYDIEGVGIAPDVQVSAEEGEGDVQKEYAMNMAASAANR